MSVQKVKKNVFLQIAWVVKNLGRYVANTWDSMLSILLYKSMEKGTVEY